ncbi:MAG: hypothetical protein E6Q97_07665 [Desulfurellales bacterium]|nr:MAG: hypothetical protein E6Q97_07665 [Desulfurellales bacterium]
MLLAIPFCKAKDTTDIPPGFNANTWTKTVKHDGWRCQFRKGLGLLTAHARTTEITQWLFQRDWFAELQRRLPDGTVIDAELYCEDEPASSVPTYLRDASQPLRIAPFALPMYAGHRLIREAAIINHDRLQTLWSAYPFFEAPINLDVSYENDTVEGFVFKERAYEGWWKQKKVWSYDFIVVGKVPGNGKYTGQLGAIEIGLLASDGSIRKFGQCSGMDDAMRLADPFVVGETVVEVEYNGQLANGGLRHPRFTRLRPDKPKEDCRCE